MRATTVMIVGMILGLAMGAGLSWMAYGRVPPLQIATGNSAASEGPLLRLEERNHDFGLIEAGIKVRHAFRMRNDGRAPLVLASGNTSCSKCTILELAKNRLEPGESTDVVVEFLPLYGQDTFRQSAWINTNDPVQGRVELNIVGRVLAKYRVIPDKFVLSHISSNETTQAELRVLTYLADEVELVGYSLIEPETAQYFEAQGEPLPADQLGDPTAKAGCRVRLTIKPGLPLGPLRQTIRLEMRMAGSEQNPLIDVTIEGSVSSDISIVGAGWNADLNRLSIGPVAGATGTTRKLTVLVHGEHRRAVALRPLSSDPAWLKVHVGEATELNEAVMQYPLTIEIPPGMPPTNRSGTDQGPLAEIVLGVEGHPQIHEVRLHLRFLIE